MNQLQALATPFPPRYVHTNPSGGGSYVKHSTVVQRLLMACGPFSFTTDVVIRGHVDAIQSNPNGKSKRARDGAPALTDAVVGALCTLTVVIDGREVRITEVGDCESPHNWPHDGARAKDAASDALKRCAARIGLGLHLWSQDEYFLDRKLSEGGSDGQTEPSDPPKDKS